MGGLEGYIGFNPQPVVESMQHHHLPLPTLAALHIGKSSNDFVNNYATTRLKDTIYLPSNTVVATLDFARNGAYRTKYKSMFRILPLMKNFQELPASGQVNLSGITSGEYLVQIRTETINGLSAQTKTWILYKSPHFYETQFFYAGILLSLGLITYLILIGKVQQQKKKNYYDVSLRAICMMKLEVY